MTWPKHARTLAAAVLLGAGGIVAVVVPAVSSQAATTTLCNSQTTPAAGGSYTIQNNEWGSSAAECITTDGNADFTVANSSIANATNGAPGGYPSIYKGCHWGACTPGSGMPIQVSNLGSGAATTSWSTTQPGGSSAYDVAYDIWFNQTPTTSGQPNGAELMVWLNHNGPVQPFGSQVASNVSVGGHTYNVWFGNQGWNTISYTMTSGATSVSNLDIGQLAANAVSRGYVQNSWYLIDVEAGFELWQGGAGLATNSFSVSTSGGSGTPSPSPSVTPSRTPTPSPSPTSSGSAACSVAYSLVNSWSGGFQAQAVITNTGSSPVNGWTLAWTFPGDQKISSLWNGTYSQSGESVRVVNASYNGTIPARGTVTVGFTGTFTSNNTAPSSFTLNGAACG
jgi:hypothetical protein